MFPFLFFPSESWLSDNTKKAVYIITYKTSKSKLYVTTGLHSNAESPCVKFLHAKTSVINKLRLRTLNQKSIGREKLKTGINFDLTPISNSTIERHPYMIFSAKVHFKKKI